MNVFTKFFYRDQNATERAADDAIIRSREVSIATNRLHDVLDRMLDENADLTGRLRRDVSKPRPQ